MKSVQRRDLHLAYEERGHRAPLLFIHAFPLDHAMWQPQMGAFERNRRLIAPDLMGFGRSGAAGHQTLDEHADDLVALLDELQVERAVAVGLSMGGYVAMAMWRRHRERIAALVLADTRAAADGPDERAAREAAAESVARDGVAALVGGSIGRLLAPSAAPELVRDVEHMMLRQGKAGVIAALSAMARRPDSTPDLPAISVPTLVVVGTEDVVTPPEEAEEIAAAVPGAQLKAIPSAGHLSNLEEPGAFNAVLREFLELVDSRPPVET